MLDGSTSVLEHTSFDARNSLARDAHLSLTRDALHARFLRRKREQSAWDAEEARDLRIAESNQHWLHYGCVTIVEYLEVYCGIEPRTVTVCRDPCLCRRSRRAPSSTMRSSRH
ncbi:MAG: hypothetical protein AB7T06_32055 [Kofleriaceae bacterium]